ncbi:ricin-type beta-trefoil lectin domain protein [Streptomyces sp. NBC_00365]|uniref:RICIN domain-containing protein n=1 Tax=Streptomyces sp. NBC_00365 TaxID=2975726 RepID=UPI00225A4465|nr:RICIN domain-containing protein [Streptomyces sp. NBC_00365]MCX5091850.1 ricin-type beta-trefoil lectin domain protein [Streptomyces sp. NBC_00365]
MAGLATPVVPLASLALLATIAVHPEPTADRDPRTSPVADSYDGFDTKAAEQLRLDQCLMADGLRRGGPNLYSLASTSLPLPADQLHQKADRTYGTGAFAQAWQKDSDDSDAWVKKAEDTDLSWKKTISGLDDYPGSPKAEKVFDKTGMLPWLYQSYFKSVDLLSPFYDPSPQADDKTKKAALAVGDPLYTSGGTSEEQEAWKLWKKNSGDVVPGEIFVPRVFDDDARIFLASGGFPRTVPAPDSPEFRVAVEDLKSRFASCAWHDPIDPDRVLGKEVAQASGEWQQEIASQATQRNQILAAGSTATKALQDGTFALGRMLGQSWIADYSTRWLDYYTEGGLGWIGDGQLEIQVPGAAGKCLDVAGGGKTNGTPVQVYTCNGGASQKWQLLGSYDGGYTLVNPNSFKCLEVLNGNSADGTKIQIRDCGSAQAQQWKFDVRSAGPLVNAATGKCLHLPTFDNSKDAVLSACNGSAAQKFRIVPKTHTGTAPAKADVDKAKANITAAQAEAKKQLALLKTQLDTAQKAATTSDTALQAAYGIADTNGAPRGRGLLVGLQKDQVTKGAAAALQALEKAGETAEAATRAAAGDSATIAQHALAQAAQSKAEFRKKAAETAELQAKAAADAAKIHRDNAKKDKETAEARLTDALKAEGDAKAAGADAHAKRLAAEAEEKTAKAEKENAAAKRAEAAEHKKNAESEATKAKDAKGKAEAAEKTAGDRRDDAVKASDHAKAMRDDAWDAEQKADAARAKADAKVAYADSLDSGDAADAARAAADEADAAADTAEGAATRARSEADAATQAAADADAAATRAEAAAKRARSDADAAQADKLKADAAVRTATSAVADAIKASQDASAEAKTAVKLANEAEQHAKDAKTQANAANAEAGKALAAAAKAAGFAHVTAQAAVDAGEAAKQVANPANDAIQLGSAYVDTDSAAGLVVLTGQASKTIAGQQQAVADAHAKNAAAEAQAAKNLADQAKGDAKEAYQHAANAAQYAADARTYSKEALGYAAEAAKAASAAADSLARTVEYDKQAAEDAAAADKAAGNAEGYAKDARDSADAAELDAAAARSAAAEAEQDAKNARAAADRADAAATEAEQAAKDADKYAKEAQDAADRAEKAGKAKQIDDGTITDERGSIGNVFYVVDHIEKIGEPEVVTKSGGCDHWWDHLAYRGNCTITSKIRYKAVLSLYLCAAEGIDPQKLMCPTDATTYLGEVKTDELSQEFTHTITIAEWQDGVDPIDILFGSWIKCAQKFTSGFESGSWGGCAWASLDVASLFAGKIIRPIAEALRAVDAAFATGIGVRDAFKALKAIDGIDTAAVAAIEREVELYEDLTTACTRNSFPGETQVLMGDGSHKAIRDIRLGDLVRATDPETGRPSVRRVTDTLRHNTRRLVDITVADGRLSSTPGHRFFVEGRGWTLVSALHMGDSLRTPDGTFRTVTAVKDRAGLTPQDVFDLTVDGIHTFYVSTEGAHPQSVLVHNCEDIVADEDIEGAHTISEHVNKTDAQMEAKALDPRTTGGVATRWFNTDIARDAVNKAMTQWLEHSPKHLKELTDWETEQAQRMGRKLPTKLKTIRWQVRDIETGGKPLGHKWVKTGETAQKSEVTSKWVIVQLKYIGKKVAQHRQGKWVVYTSYLEG